MVCKRTNVLCHTQLLLCVLAANLLGACLAPGSQQMPRTVDGRRWNNAPVAPAAYAWFARAEVLTRRGRYVDAIAAYRHSIREADTPDEFVFARLATTLSLAGRHREAQLLSEMTLAKFPTSEAAWIAWADVKERRGSSNAALRGYARAAAVTPGYPAAPLRLERALRQMSLPHAGDEVLWSHQVSRKGFTRAAARRRFTEGARRKDYHSVREAAPLLVSSDASLLRHMAERALTSADPSLALIIARAAFAEPWAKRVYIRALLQRGRPQAARSVLSRLDSQAVGGFEQAARLHLVAGLDQEAWRLTQVLTVEQPASPVLLLRIQAAVEAGALDDALQALEQLSSRALEYPSACAAVALGLRREAMDRASISLLESCRRRCASSQLDRALAQLLAEQGEYRRSLKLLRDDHSLWGQALYGKILELRGDAKKAYHVFQQLGDHLPSRAQTVPEWVRMRYEVEHLLQHNRLSPAARVLTRYLDHHPEDATALARLAEVRAAQGKEKQARALASAALALGASTSIKKRMRALAQPR